MDIEHDLVFIELTPVLSSPPTVLVLIYSVKKQWLVSIVQCKQPPSSFPRSRPAGARRSRGGLPGLELNPASSEPPPGTTQIENEAN